LCLPKNSSKQAVFAQGKNYMKSLLKFALGGTALALSLAALPAKPVAVAQDGGIIVEATFGTGPNQLNPLFCNDTACRRIVALTFPGLAGVNPETAVIEPGAVGGLNSTYTLSEDNTVVTFTLDPMWKWSDGTPITAKDVAYSWEVVSNPDAGSDYNFLTGLIKSVETPDDMTVVVTLQQSDCNAVSNAAGIPIAPAHIFADKDVKTLKDDAFSTAPTTSSGIFKFAEYRAGEQTSLEANAEYPAAADGVKPAGFIYKVVADQTVLVEQFLAGETNLMDGPPVNRRSDVKDMGDKGDAQVFGFPGNSWDYLAMNFADPANPQPGLDANGAPVDQGKHPVLGGAAMRKAIAMAIDVDALVQGAVFGEGSRMAANMIPTSWAADPDLAPIAFDAEGAAAMLDEAGWVLGADGIREKDGVKASFSIITNAGNTRREAIATLASEYLKAIGVEAKVELLDFNLVLERMDKQDFDAVILGWRNGFPDDPDQSQLFGAASDVPGSGNNFTSYYSAKFEELQKAALTVPGCAIADRAALYYEAQKLFQEDLPYVPLFVVNGMYAASSGVEGFAPKPNQLLWNVETWSVVAK
jgi:peptide/nickel transport system substrate-binding protein